MPRIENGNYIKESYADIYNSLVVEMQKEFGSLAGYTDSDPLIILAKIFARVVADKEEDWEDVFFSLFLSTATGQPLDDLADPFVRKAKNKAGGEVKITFENNHPLVTIDKGSVLILDTAGVKYEVVNSVVVAQDEAVANIHVEALAAGVGGNASMNSMLTFESPVENVVSIIFIQNVINGRLAETDEEFRRRFRNLVQGLSSDTSVVNIQEGLINVDPVNVLYVQPYFNNTNTAVNGVPARGYEIVIRLGTDSPSLRTEVAKQLARIIPPYVPAKVSGHAETFSDVNSATELRYITYASVEPLTILYDIKVDDSFTADDSRIIMERVIGYIGGVFTDRDGAFISKEGEINVGGVVEIVKLEGLLYELLDTSRLKGVLAIDRVRCTDSSGLQAGSTVIRGIVRALLPLGRDKYPSLTNSDITIVPVVVNREDYMAT